MLFLLIRGEVLGFGVLDREEGWGLEYFLGVIFLFCYYSGWLLYSFGRRL